MDAVQPQVKWWQTSALLEVAGPDAVNLLDGLCTQAVERIEPGTARLGLFLDAKAAIIAPAILHRADREATDEAPRLLLETLPELVDDLAAHLRRYRLRAKVLIEPSDLTLIAAIGAETPALDPDVPVTARTHRSAYGTTLHAIIASPEACHEHVQHLTSHGYSLADPDELEAARIEAGQADLHDLLPGRMPAEVGGMADAVALDAGCYLGQEPVARLHYRGRANRSLRRLEAHGALAIDGAPDVASPLELRRADDRDGRPVGRLTTWARRPDGSTIALGMLRREVEQGELLTLPGSDLPLAPLEPHG